MTTITANWQQIGNNEMTNLYLYGQLTTPTDLTNENIINNEYVNLQLTGLDTFMSVGPGRYASGVQLGVVSKFMSGDIMPNNGKDQLMSLTDIMASTQESRFFVILHPAYGINDSDYDTRSYIYGHESFALNKNAKFVVKADGTRYIQDYAILPADGDFDFVTQPDKWLQQWGDTTFLGNKIDPSGIGKTTLMTFDQTTKDAYV